MRESDKSEVKSESRFLDLCKIVFWSSTRRRERGNFFDIFKAGSGLLLNIFLQKYFLCFDLSGFKFFKIFISKFQFLGGLSMINFWKKFSGPEVDYYVRFFLPIFLFIFYYSFFKFPLFSKFFTWLLSKFPFLIFIFSNFQILFSKFPVFVSKLPFFSKISIFSNIPFFKSENCIEKNFVDFDISTIVGLAKIWHSVTEHTHNGVNWFMGKWTILQYLFISDKNLSIIFFYIFF